MVETALAERAELADSGDAVRLLASMMDKVLRPLLDEETCLLLGLLVSDVHLRDLAWALMTPTNAEDHVRLWGVVVAHVLPRWPQRRCVCWAWLRGWAVRAHC